jgi:hypothetical protein
VRVPVSRSANPAPDPDGGRAPRCLALTLGKELVILRADVNVLLAIAKKSPGGSGNYCSGRTLAMGGKPQVRSPLALEAAGSTWHRRFQTSGRQSSGADPTPASIVVKQCAQHKLSLLQALDLGAKSGLCMRWHGGWRRSQSFPHRLRTALGERLPDPLREFFRFLFLPERAVRVNRALIV